MKKREDKRGNIFHKKQHKGQFFIIAAVVIIVVVVSIVTISNWVEKRDVERTYILAQEVGIEGRNILEHGIYNELNETEMKTLMEEFIKEYVDYIQEKKNVYFIFGNKYKINVAGYQEIVEESVCVNVTGICTPYLKIGETQEFPVGEGVTKIGIIIGGVEYYFKLKMGENFYFVIWQKFGEEKIVFTSED